MINLEGFRMYKEIKLNNIKELNFINDDDFNDLINHSIQKFNNCEDILNEFGDFSKEINVYKNTSRKGMIFSDTKFITDVNIYNVIPLEDEKKGKYIITDGIGKISEDLLDLSCKVWGIDNTNKRIISAIQIRFMGCKGVLALDPDLPKNTVHFRESQKKFETDDTTLNICSVANYKEGFLNRQFIILLSTLGVDDKIFENIEDNIINRYMDLLTDPYKAFCNDNSLKKEFKEILGYFAKTFEYFLSKKINLLVEPLFSQFLNIFVYSKLINIKYDGRLSDNKCVCLMGVIDETNTLKENQVYIHLINSNENIDLILEQPILVYRSPSLFPGDIQKFKAVNNPLLKHMVNVIVFSKKGIRPKFNELSGGDLDGDRYFILYNETIINSIKNLYKPLEDIKYSDNNNIKSIKKEKITIKDSIKCIINTTSNNLVGLICNNHMAFADESKYKAKDEKCVKLCEYFNQEIDACKLGNFIELSTLKKENLIKQKKPDFLSNGILNKYNMYISPGILGKLYRKINKNKIFNSFKYNFFEKAIRRKYEINYNLITKNCFKYLSDAYVIYDSYKISLCNLMKKYNFCTETELFLNIRIFKNNRGYRGKSNSSSLELAELIENIHKKIIEIFKVIDMDVASAIYVSSYINVKSVYEKKVSFTEDYDENLAKLISLFEKEKDDLKILFPSYHKYSNIKVRHKQENKNKFKRVFSLPWIINDIRKLLIKN